MSGDIPWISSGLLGRSNGDTPHWIRLGYQTGAHTNWDTQIAMFLVGGWATPLKNMKVNWDDYSQYMGNLKKMATKPPTMFDCPILISIDDIPFGSQPRHLPPPSNNKHSHGIPFISTLFRWDKIRDVLMLHFYPINLVLILRVYSTVVLGNQIGISSTPLQSHSSSIKSPPISHSYCTISSILSINFLLCSQLVSFNITILFWHKTLRYTALGILMYINNVPYCHLLSVTICQHLIISYIISIPQYQYP